MKGSPTMRREFDREARQYDRTARASIPGYSDLHWMLSRGIPYLPTRAFQVLELGVGTGTLTELLLSEFPHAQVTGIDISPKMIARARTKLHRYRGRVELVPGPLEEFHEGTYDVVVSALAIHHLADPAKWRLFRRIHRTLAPGGYFGDGDDHLPEDPVFDRPVRADRGGRGARDARSRLLEQPPGGLARAREVRPAMHSEQRGLASRACGVPARRSAVEVLRASGGVGLQVRVGPLRSPGWPDMASRNDVATRRRPRNDARGEPPDEVRVVRRRSRFSGGGATGCLRDRHGASLPPRRAPLSGRTPPSGGDPGSAASGGPTGLTALGFKPNLYLGSSSRNAVAGMG